jgi:hypothetical protein
MQIPFDKKSLPKDLQHSLKVAYDTIDWTSAIELTNKYLETQTVNDDLLLCIVFCKTQQALVVDMDNEVQVIEQGLIDLQKLKRPTLLAKQFIVNLKATITEFQKKWQALEDLNKLPIIDLSIEQKKDLAYHLIDQGGVDNNKKVAILFSDVLQSVEESEDRFFYLSLYTIALFRSNEIELAEHNFSNLLDWEEDGPEENPWLLSKLYFEKLICYKNDKHQFLAIWQEAIQNEFVLEEDLFPISLAHQQIIMDIAVEYEIDEILNFLKR